MVLILVIAVDGLGDVEVDNLVVSVDSVLILVIAVDGLGVAMHLEKKVKGMIPS